MVGAGLHKNSSNRKSAKFITTQTDMVSSNMVSSNMNSSNMVSSNMVSSDMINMIARLRVASTKKNQQDRRSPTTHIHKIKSSNNKKITRSEEE